MRMSRTVSVSLAAALLPACRIASSVTPLSRQTSKNDADAGGGGPTTVSSLGIGINVCCTTALGIECT